MTTPKPEIGDIPDLAHALMQSNLLLMPFIDASGSSVLTDFSGLGNNGTLINLGGSPWLGDNGGALQFNGAGYVDVSNISSTLFGGDFTVIGEVATTSGSLPTEFIVGKELAEGVGFAFFTRATQSAYEIRISGGQTGPKIQAGNNSAIPLIYQRVVVTRNGNTVSFYVDGVLKNSGAFNFDGASLAVLRIGATTWSTVLASTGKISDIRVYDRGFDQADVDLDTLDPWEMFKKVPLASVSRKVISGDVLLFQTVDDGEIKAENGIIELTESFETAVYLSLFGGSDWWADSRQNSETEGILDGLPATSGNIVKVKEAVERDLKWMKSESIASSIRVVVSIPALNRVKISIDIEARGEVSQFNFVENWRAK